jgi:hypothetical protein
MNTTPEKREIELPTVGTQTENSTNGGGLRYRSGLVS